MPRTLKQILYGIFFLLIFAGLIAGSYFLFIKPEATCFDSRKNQKEEQIDCGGPCIPCELKTLKLTLSPVEIKSSPARTTLIAKITNPSSNYGLKSFDYRFEIYGPFGAKLQPSEGTSSIKPSESKYIIAPGLSLDSRDVSVTELKILNSDWVGKEELPVYQIETSKIATDLLKEAIEVTGIIENKGPEELKAIAIKAILFDKNGGTVNASETKIDRIGAFGQSSFTIFFPRGIAANTVDASRTVVFTEVRPK